jgi:UPF0755 protein
MFRKKRILNNTLFKKKNNPFITMLKVSIVIFIILWLFIYKDYSNFKVKSFVNSDIVLKIEEWEKIEKVAEKLEINMNYFKIYLKYNNPEFKLIAWNFRIKKDSNIEQVLEWLSIPIILNEIDITLLEWWNIYDIDEYLSKKWLIKSWKYIWYVNNSEKITKLKEFFPFIDKLSTLEWYLYPDTYRVVENNFKINVLVIKQLENFEKKVYDKIKPFSWILSAYQEKESTNINLALEKLVNLASIVEKEEKNSKEKATVAWILKKRLEDWWMIWADITVCYPHKLTSKQCKMVVSKYINEKNKYNTRTMKGLPKTPIWNPSFETINATINYKKTPYWFYLHNSKTWKVYYAETNADHEKNKRLYMK